MKKTAVFISVGIALAGCSAPKAQLEATNPADGAANSYLLTNSIEIPAIHRANGTTAHFPVKSTLIILNNDTLQIQKK